MHNVGLYHPSLAEWFTQTKFCGPAFACNSEDGVIMIRDWRQRHGAGDKPDLVSGCLDLDLDNEARVLLWF